MIPRTLHHRTVRESDRVHIQHTPGNDICDFLPPSVRIDYSIPYRNIPHTNKPSRGQNFRIQRLRKPEPISCPVPLHRRLPDIWREPSLQHPQLLHRQHRGQRLHAHRVVAQHQIEGLGVLRDVRHVLGLGVGEAGHLPHRPTHAHRRVLRVVISLLQLQRIDVVQIQIERGLQLLGQQVGDLLGQRGIHMCGPDPHVDPLTQQRHYQTDAIVAVARVDTQRDSDQNSHLRLLGLLDVHPSVTPKPARETLIPPPSGSANTDHSSRRSQPSVRMSPHITTE